MLGLKLHHPYPSYPPPPAMAGLTSTFHHPCKSQLPKTFKPFSIHLHTFSLRILSPKATRYPSISTTISARYGGGGGGGGGRRPKPVEDEALDFSLVKWVCESAYSWDKVLIFTNCCVVVLISLVWNRSDTVRLIDQQQKMVSYCVCVEREKDLFGWRLYCDFDGFDD